MPDPASYVGRRIQVIVPGTSAGDIRFPAGKVVGLRTRTTVFAMRKGRKFPEESEALIFAVRLDREFRSPLTEAPIRGLLLDFRDPENLDEEFAGRIGGRRPRVLVTAVIDPKILDSPEKEPDLTEKNSDHYGPGFIEPA